MGIRVGIDLGATFSKIAYVDEYGCVMAIENAEGTRMTPSAVCFSDTNYVVVGEAAKENAIIDPENTILMVKRMIGKTDFSINYKGKEISPEEVLSYILRKIVDDAKIVVGEEIEGAVITVPTYFCAKECTAVRKAAELAGINLISLLTETTAAAISYGLCQNAEERTVLIYDLGGSSLDISVAKVNEEKVSVICSGRGIEVGGIDWDNALINYLKYEFLSETGLADLDIYTLQDIQIKAEKAKIKLSTQNLVPVILRAGDEKVKFEISRELFEAITTNLLNKTIDATEEVLAVANEMGHNIDEIILVGGGSKMPQVARILFDKYGLVPKLYEPDLSIAKGAAIYASKNKANDVRPICSKSYGIKVIHEGKELCHNFIVRNTPLQGQSLSVSNVVGISNPELGIISLEIYESDTLEDQFPIDNRLMIGTLNFRIPQNKVNNVFEVIFNLSLDGILEVACLDRETRMELTSARFGVSL